MLLSGPSRPPCCLRLRGAGLNGVAALSTTVVSVVGGVLAVVRLKI